MKKLLLVLTIAFSTSVMFAGGYRVGVQGHKQLAMGHTGVAVVTSAESAFFNPAGLGLIKRFEISGSIIWSGSGNVEHYLSKPRIRI